MEWIAPFEKDVTTDTLGKRLWDAADQLRPDFLFQFSIRLPAKAAAAEH